MDVKEATRSVLGREDLLMKMYGYDNAILKAAKELFMMREFDTERAKAIRDHFKELDPQGYRDIE